MSRHDEIKFALAEVLREPGTEVTGLYAVGAPMVARGSSQEEIAKVLISLDHNKFIELLPDNQLRVLSDPNGQRGFRTTGGWT